MTSSEESAPDEASSVDPRVEELALLRAQENLIRARDAQGIRPHVPTTPPPAVPPARSALGVFQAASARLAAWQATAEGQAHLAHARALEASRRRAELLEVCDARGVPLHPGTRLVVLAERPPRTVALDALEYALAWRRTQTAPGFAPPPVTLVLAGPPGVGKTTATSRLVARWPRPALRVLAREVAVLPENDWSDHAARRRELARVSLLVVDEAGLEESDRAGARVGALLAERTDGAGVTIVCTNLDGAAFAARYVGERLRSRLSVEQGRGGGDDGLSWWVDLPDVDLRDPAARAALEGGR